MSYLASGPELPTVGPTGSPTQNQLPPFRAIPQLLLERDSDNHILYRVWDNLYDATTLTPNKVPTNTMILDFVMDVPPDVYPSQPIFVKTQNDEFVFSTVDMDGQVILYMMNEEQPIPIENSANLPADTVISVVPFLIPDINGLPPVSGRLARAQLNEFNPEWYKRIVTLVNNDMFLNQLNISQVYTEVDMDLTPIQSPRDISMAPWGAPTIRPTLPARFSPEIQFRSPTTEFGTLPDEQLTPEYSTVVSYRDRFNIDHSSFPTREVDMASPQFSTIPFMQQASPPDSPMNLPSTGLPEYSPSSRRYSPEFPRRGSQSPSSPVRRRLFTESPERSLSPIDTELMESAYQTLLKQLYGIPVEIPATLVTNELPTPVIAFEEASRLLSSGQVQSYTLDPLLQPWAGPPSGNNRMITLILRNGTTVLVKAAYNTTSNEIFPPV